MILVDTSVWIDHLHEAEPRLVEALEHDEVACHPLVIQELALGTIVDRDALLESLASLRQCSSLSHEEFLTLVASRQLWGKGLNAVDCHLLGSVMVSGGVSLWTRDKRLRSVAEDRAVSVVTWR